MSDNRFSDCETAEEVLMKFWRVLPLGLVNELLPSALARIRELMSPTPEQRKRVDFAPDELLTLAKIVDDFERLYNDVAQVVAPDTMRTTLDLDIIDGDLPVRVVCNDHGCWVLRIGGDQ